MDKEHLMSGLLSPNCPPCFLIFFAVMWLAVSIVLGFVSGWYALMKDYPNRPEESLRTFAWQSGTMNFVGMHSILNLSVCPSGLRVGMVRIFGIFCRDFFVPWNAISVGRKDRALWKVAKISFGQPAVGSLTIPSEVADRIARAAGRLWPEQGPFPEETGSQASSRIIKQWAAMTSLAAAFFVIAPRLMAPTGSAMPPIRVAVLFPAIVFGAVGLVQYLRRERP